MKKRFLLNENKRGTESFSGKSVLRLPGIELNRLDYGEAICHLPPEEIEATLRQIRALV